MIERKIAIGLIASTEYIKQIRRSFDLQFILGAPIKKIAEWCLLYFDQYDKAPGEDIKAIFYQRVSEGKVSPGLAEGIENIVLPSLNAEYQNDGINVEYLVTETLKYFTERHLELFTDKIRGLYKNGQIIEAQRLAGEYKPLQMDTDLGVDLGDKSILDKLDRVFDVTKQPVIELEGALGVFLNRHLIKGGLVAFMGPEKRGKTFMLMHFALAACMQNKNVAFFQAGDMTEEQQLKRISITISHRSDDQDDCSEMFEPVADCIHNQTHNCEHRVRTCNFGIFEGYTPQQIREEMLMEDLIKAWEDNPDYVPCTNCRNYLRKPYGAVWLKKIPEVPTLDKDMAKEYFNEFFIKHQRKFKLSSHANGTLTLTKIRSILAVWEQQEGFVPDVILIDYADILETENIMEERPKQNQIWKGLRRLSQEKGMPLVITATQSDASSYDQKIIKRKNFSEDKRKYAHATAFYGLNQDPDNREKRIGLIRLNEIVIREGYFAKAKEVFVLQNLRRGQANIGSFF